MPLCRARQPPWLPQRAPVIILLLLLLCLPDPVISSLLREGRQQLLQQQQQQQQQQQVEEIRIHEPAEAIVEIDASGQQQQQQQQHEQEELFKALPPPQPPQRDQEDAGIARLLQRWLDEEDAKTRRDLNENEEEDEDKDVEKEENDALALADLGNSTGNLEVYKAFREIAVAHNFTARDFWTLQGLILKLSFNRYGDKPTIFPMCEIYKIVGPMRLHCVFILSSYRFYTAQPPSLRMVATERSYSSKSGGEQKEQEQQQQQQPPPHVLQDIGVVPDFIVDQILIEKERPVYRWCWRQIVNMIGFTYRWNDEGVAAATAKQQQHTQEKEARDKDGGAPFPCNQKENSSSSSSSESSESSKSSSSSSSSSDSFPLLPPEPGYGNQSLLWVEGPMDIPFRRPIGQVFTYFPPPCSSSSGRGSSSSSSRSSSGGGDRECEGRGEGGGEGGGGESPELVVVIRGTLYSEEWTANFRLQRADEDEMEKYGFEGVMVPKGFFGLFTEVLPQVNNALVLHGNSNVTRLTLTGHSLGASIALLLAAYFGQKRPDLKISLITFGGPNTADNVLFENYWNYQINVRQVFYIGSGLVPRDERDRWLEEDRKERQQQQHPHQDLEQPSDSHLSFGIGDMVAQMPPDCTAVSPCPLLLFHATNGLTTNDDRSTTPNGFNIENNFFTRLRLARPPGSIVFHAYDLKGRGSVSTWLAYEDFLTHVWTRLDRGIIASHICAYACWVSSLGGGEGGEETRCFFPEEGEGRGLGEICDLKLTRSERMVQTHL